MTLTADPPYHILGYPPLNGDMLGNPLFEPTLSLDEKTRMFADWVSGYYKHPDSVDDLERRTPLTDPPPTISIMTPEERAAALYPSPGDPATGGSDSVLNLAGIPSGVWPDIKEMVMRRPLSDGKVNGNGDAATRTGRSWADVELCYLWCDASVWEAIWGVHCMRREVQEARAARRKLRKVTFVQIKDANHFVSDDLGVTRRYTDDLLMMQIHWDRPEAALQACLAKTSETEEVVIGCKMV